jgi:hypothetical protein
MGDNSRVRNIGTLQAYSRRNGMFVRDYGEVK